MKKIILTGGSGGIGSSIYSKLTTNYDVVNLDKNPPTGKMQNFIQTDLTSSNSVLSSVEKSLKTGGIYGLVHCAGYGGPYQKLSEFSEKDWDNVFLINVKSAYLILQKILPILQKNKMGRVVFIASSLSVVGASGSAAYSASKHALIGLTKSLASEWGEFGITVNSISPGYVDTAMGVREDQVSSHRQKILEMTPSKKIAKPEEISRIVEFLLHEDSSYINGANWTVDGGITAV